MLLLFRFALLLLRGRLRPRIGPLDESVVRFTALPNDCDLNFHLNAGRFVSFMDIARMELLVRNRILITLLRHGWRPLMGGCTVRFRRSVLPFQRFDVRSRVMGWDAKWFYFEHVVEINGAFCASGVMRVLFRRNGASATPEEIFAMLKIDGPASPPLPEFVDRWRHSEDVR